MPGTSRFTGRVAVVLGGGDDVGRETATQLSQEGATVVVAGKDPAMIAETCAADAGAGELIGRPLDIEDEGALRVLAAEVDNRWGVVHALVTAYLACPFQSLENTTLQDWQRVMHTNLTAPFLASNAFLHLLKRGDGKASITHMTTIDGILGNPSVPAYSASKGGTNILTHVAAAEFAPYGIRVNAVARCSTVEVLGLLGRENLTRPLIDATPSGRVGYARETAAVFTFLASDDASWVTGTVVPVDGGRSVLTPGTALGVTASFMQS